MAEYKSQKTGPGILIFTAIVALIFLAIVVGKFSFFDHTRDVTLYFDSVSGIKERSSVVYAGRKCGEVRSIEVLKTGVPHEIRNEESGSVRTNYYYVKLIAKVQDDIPVDSDTKLSIMMVGMLGDKQVDLAPGKPDASPLGPGDALYGENAGMERLVTTGRKLVVKLEAMMQNVQTLLGHVNNVMKDPQFQDNLKGTVANARNTLEKAGATLNHAKELLGENRENIKGTLANAKELTEKGKTTIGTLNATLGETRPRLQKTLSNVAELTTEIRPKVSTLLEKTTTTVGKAGDTLDTTRGLISDNRQNITVLLTNLRDTGANTKQFTKTLRYVFAPWTAFDEDKTNAPTKGQITVPATNATQSISAPVSGSGADSAAKPAPAVK